MDEHYINVAAASQALLEDVLCDVVKGFAEQTGIRHICMAGGVALNCAANRKILDLDCIDSLYIQPASSDAGISLGAAYLASAEFDIKPEPMTTALLGRAFADEEVKTVLGQLGAKYKYVEEPWNVATDLILEQKVLGWVNGRAEFGPRALGSHSILASPYDGDMKNKINQRIKFREGFRPFCPSILEEDFNKAFQSSTSNHPNMTVNVRVTSDIFPAITHVDQTARVQTISSENESPFAKVLKSMQQKTGTGIVVNTSFNRNKEPMVYSIIDAVSAFHGSGLDALFIGNFMVSK
jgi:carbamoyltransferase